MEKIVACGNLMYTGENLQIWDLDAQYRVPPHMDNLWTFGRKLPAFWQYIGLGEYFKKYYIFDKKFISSLLVGCRPVRQPYMNSCHTIEWPEWKRGGKSGVKRKELPSPLWEECWLILYWINVEHSSYVSTVFTDWLPLKVLHKYRTWWDEKEFVSVIQSCMM